MLTERIDLVKTLAAFLALALAWCGYRHFNAPLTHAHGILVHQEPEQSALVEDAPPINRGDFQLKPLARFSVEARVLHRRNYRYDRGATISPTDLAIGWGKMSDQAVLDRLKISQSARFYWYEYQLPPPIAPDEIMRQSTNIHLIPADRAIARSCRSLRAGELVRLEGQLVEATAAEIGTWRSSLRRDDSGKGACELLFVEQLTKLGPEAITPALLVRR